MQPRDRTSQNGKNCKENIRDIKRKKSFQQFIRTRNYSLQFMQLAAQGKQNVSFRHRQWYIAENQTKDSN